MSSNDVLCNGLSIKIILIALIIWFNCLYVCVTIYTTGIYKFTILYL